MKRFFSLLLICCILGQASIRTIWTLNYQLDRAAYLQKCENKDKPKMHCDGKCYLKKQLGAGKSDNSKEPKLPDSFREIKDLQLFCEVLNLPVIVPFNFIQPPALPPYQFSSPVAFVKGVFRPPALI